MTIKVYIWRALTTGTVGHVSMETSKYYISIWPDVTRQILYALMPRGAPAILRVHKNADIEFQTRDPDEVFNLFKLDEEIINSKFEEFLSANDVELKRAQKEVDMSGDGIIYLSQTKYSIVAPIDNLHHWADFIRSPLCCTTFTFGLIVEGSNVRISHEISKTAPPWFGNQRGNQKRIFVQVGSYKNYYCKFDAQFGAMPLLQVFHFENHLRGYLSYESGLCNFSAIDGGRNFLLPFIAFVVSLIFEFAFPRTRASLVFLGMTVFSACLVVFNSL